jgi:hypothetical protein
MKHILMAAGLAACAAANAQTCSGRSPAHTVALLELYTSEGCSSCPPADRFVSTLRAAKLAPDRMVPLALHVDYWNSIGWQDPFSSAEFTGRQRSLAGLAGSSLVYTPEIFVGAREVRDWRSAVPDLVKDINATPARAAIGVAIGTPAAAGLPVEVKAHDPGGALLQVALVQNNLASKVTRGENEGRTLHHDFVVRQWLPAKPIGSDGSATVARVMPLPRGAPAADFAVSAFVQSAGGEILQAFSLPVCTPAG